MAIDFKTDTVLWTNQPSEVKFKPAQAVHTQMADGSYRASPRDFGAVIEVTWGVDISIDSWMTEARTKRGGLIEHSVAFTDPAGTTHTYDVLWLADPDFTIMVAYYFKAFTITFYERG